MVWFDENSIQARAYEKIRDSDGSDATELSNEVLGNAAAYETQMHWDNHTAENGRPDDLEGATIVVTEFARAIIDRVVETQGLEQIDREKTLTLARDQLVKKVAPEYKH